ncbi:14-3-3 domain-containing protein [Flagelloscypha sp. PMI_526]|nr:14-3-3 domain-containing protein [Flagelloscypha sp. PMI_526]
MGASLFQPTRLRTKRKQPAAQQHVPTEGRKKPANVISYLTPILSTGIAQPERALISMAYKNQTNDLRSSRRIVGSIEDVQQERLDSAKGSPKCASTEKRLALIKKQREKIEAELRAVCWKVDVKGGMDDIVEERAFLAENVSDYLRYLIEIYSSELDPNAPSCAELEVQALKSYTTSFHLAQQALNPIHPTRLGIGLNFSVFFHDVKRSPTRAIHIAKTVFDEGLNEILKGPERFGQRSGPGGNYRVQRLKVEEGLLETVQESDIEPPPVVESEDRRSVVRDAMFILQILRDDMIVWSAEVD